jgi:hypothetical protein
MNTDKPSQYPLPVVIAKPKTRHGRVLPTMVERATINYLVAECAFLRNTHNAYQSIIDALDELKLTAERLDVSKIKENISGMAMEGRADQMGKFVHSMTATVHRTHEGAVANYRPTAPVFYQKSISNIWPNIRLLLEPQIRQGRVNPNGAAWKSFSATTDQAVNELKTEYRRLWYSYTDYCAAIADEKMGELFKR